MKLAGELGAIGAAGGQGVCRGVAGDRARSVRAIDRAAREPDLRVELLPQPAGADAPEGARLSRRLRSHRVVEGLVDSRVRRSLHGAASRLQRRRGLLPSRQRDARDRSRGAAGADPQRRGRSVRPAAAFSTRPPCVTTRTSPPSSRRCGGHCAFVESGWPCRRSFERRRTTTATSPRRPSSISSRQRSRDASRTADTPRHAGYSACRRTCVCRAITRKK